VVHWVPPPFAIVRMWRGSGRHTGTVTSPLPIRAGTSADVPDIAEVTRRAFDRTGGEEVGMIADAHASAVFSPELSLVAVLGEQVVGPISVLPELQGRGFGSALIRRGLDVTRGRGARGVVLVGHPTYYPRFGFRPARDFGMTPDWDEAMVLPLHPGDVLRDWRGLKVPH
jgi:predicted N-acetyltransferase YhbS